MQALEEDQKAATERAAKAGAAEARKDGEAALAAKDAELTELREVPPQPDHLLLPRPYPSASPNTPPCQQDLFAAPAKDIT